MVGAADRADGYRDSVPPPTGAPGISWDWSRALLGLLYALPATAVILFGNPQLGLALAVGVMPSATLALPGLRRGRVLIVVVGGVAAACMTVGAVLAEVPVAAVVGIALLAVVAALGSSRSRIGALALALGLPLVGIGLSFADVGEAAGLGGLMILGSVWACLVSMVWPEHPRAAPPARRLPPRAALVYGCLLGAAAGLAAAIGFAADLEHVGWATAAALLVMRPARGALVLRSVGRAASVLVGALAGGLYMTTRPSPTETAVVVLLVLTGLAATQASRWYIAPAFTTFLVFVLLLWGSPADAAHRFGERTLETLLGVGLALLFGAVLPAILERSRGAAGAAETPGPPGAG